MSIELSEKAERDIIKCIVQYSWAVDDRDWDALRENVFTEDAVWEYGPIATPKGIEEIISTIQDALRTLDATQHKVSGHLIEPVSMNEVNVRTQLDAQHTRYEYPGGENCKMAGEYRDRIVLTENGWRIAHRAISITWSDGNKNIFNP